MRFARSLLVVALVLVVLAVSVHARPHRKAHRKAQGPLAPIAVDAWNFTDPASPAAAGWKDALQVPESRWESIRADLKARNYQRPQSAHDGSYGVDVSSEQSISTIQCFVSKGYSYLIARLFTEKCSVDSNGAQTVLNAWAAGMSHVDIYMSPSYGCSMSAADQVDATINFMRNGTWRDVPFGLLWFDIEVGGQGSPSQNAAWLRAGVAQAVARIGSSRVGIYSSASQWSQVMGNISDMSSFRLWYAHHDSNPSFDDFSSFGGWTSPYTKQFAGDTTLCDADVDLNWC